MGRAARAVNSAWRRTPPHVDCTCRERRGNKPCFCLDVIVQDGQRCAASFFSLRSWHGGEWGGGRERNWGGEGRGECTTTVIKTVSRWVLTGSNEAKGNDFRFYHTDRYVISYSSRNCMALTPELPVVGQRAASVTLCLCLCCTLSLPVSYLVSACVVPCPRLYCTLSLPVLYLVSACVVPCLCLCLSLIHI